jgi:hypothetical protein
VVQEREVYQSQTLPLPLIHQWCNDFREDPNRRGFQGLSDVQSFASLLHSCQLTDADIEGLTGILGCPDIAVVFQTNEDLRNLQGPIITLKIIT